VSQVVDERGTNVGWQRQPSRCTTGDYPPHHLISEVQLESEFGVARVTIRKVTNKLREDGLIVTTPGMGSFVVPKTSETPGQA
jgi:GntR family transcriptional regulator